MADYFTQFSCMFNVVSAENAVKAGDIRAEMVAELDREDGPLGFEMEACTDQGAGTLWLYSDENGEPEHVIDFVTRCAEAFDLRGQWGFRWALTCSRPRLDGFGGGAHLIDLTERKTVGWLDCEHWLAGHFADQPGTNLANQAAGAQP